MKFNKGQGALEYLLLIGGAVLIAVIVIALLVGMGSSSRQGTQERQESIDNTIAGTAIAPILNAVTCANNTLNLRYIYNGGTLEYSLNNGAWTAVGETDGNTNISVTTCPVVPYSVQLRSTNASGQIALSSTFTVRT